MKSSNILSLYGCEIPVNAAEKNKDGEKNQVTLPEHSQAWEDEGSYPVADRRSRDVAVWADLILTCFFSFLKLTPFENTQAVFFNTMWWEKKSWGNQSESETVCV